MQNGKTYKQNMTRKTAYILCLLTAVAGLVVSCQKHSYDFNYSPLSPKAGEKVTFTNQSDAGENWVWKFGDGGYSTLKSPTHIYTAAGLYTVELMVDSSKQKMITHNITVLDSIPSIYLPSDTVRQYAPVTLKASYYNPTKAEVNYLWTVDENLFVITEGSLISDSVCGYFTDFGKSTEVHLSITIGTKMTEDSRTLTLLDNDAPTLLMQTQLGYLWRQRIYNGIYEKPKIFDGDASLINQANDSTATLNGVTYDIYNMPVLADKNVNALQVDPVNRKLYVILDDGLYVANANGDALTCISNIPASTLLVDTERNSLYWSDAAGVWSMPLVTHPQNVLSEQLVERVRYVNDLLVARMTIID